MAAPFLFSSSQDDTLREMNAIWARDCPRAAPGRPMNGNGHTAQGHHACRQSSSQAYLVPSLKSPAASLGTSGLARNTLRRMGLDLSSRN